MGRQQQSQGVMCQDCAWAHDGRKLYTVGSSISVVGGTAGDMLQVRHASACSLSSPTMRDARLTELPK
jgi:hypothetical protein